MRRIYLGLLLCCALACAACASSSMNIGKPIDMNKFNLVEKGVTTEAELLSLMGKPQMVQRSSNGTSYTYMFHGASSLGVIVPGASASMINSTLQYVGFTVKDGVVVDKSELSSNMDSTIGGAVVPIVP